MRILFVLKGLALVRHFDEVVAHLADAGHQIILAPMKLGDEKFLPEALSSHANCDVVVTTAKRTEAAHSTGILRQARDYLRYWEPWLAGAEANRRRALSHLLRAVSGNTRDPGVDLPGAWSLSKNEVRCLRRLFDEVERFLPPAPTVERFIAAQRPDVMLVTPLVSFGGAQADYIKAARRLGIPSACPVFSWDNLTNKGVMHERPDRTFVWNEVQRQEAIRMHGVDPEAVIATGAPRFDSFFRRAPSSTREEYCPPRSGSAWTCPRTTPTPTADSSPTWARRRLFRRASRSSSRGGHRRCGRHPRRHCDTPRSSFGRTRATRVCGRSTPASQRRPTTRAYPTSW